MSFGRGFIEFVKAIQRTDKTERIPYRREFKRMTEKYAAKRKPATIAAIKGTVPALKPLPGRTDFSTDADVHIERLKGERPVRKMHRKMQRIRARRIRRAS